MSMANGREMRNKKTRILIDRIWSSGCVSILMMVKVNHVVKSIEEKEEAYPSDGYIRA
jgi:hypothetical protein